MTEIHLDGAAAEPSGAAPGARPGRYAAREAGEAPEYAARGAGEAPQSFRIAGRDLTWRQLGAAGFLLLGVILIVTGWIGVSQNNEVWQQMPYFVSGGVGGLAMVLIGLGLYNAHQHAVDQQGVAELCRRLEALELGLGGEFDDVLGRLDDLAVGRARVRS